jgi:CBS domain containing-hemolysin-like protein
MRENVMIAYETGEIPFLTLKAKTAADLMVPNIVWVPVTATVPETVALLTEKHISALPVLDESGQPAGVVSLSDIVAHDYQKYGHLQPGQEPDEKNHFVLRLDENQPRVLPVEWNGTARVQDIMTPVVYSVARQTPASTVVDAMLSLGVHRLFVTDEEGGIVGVISTLDVLRHLQHSQKSSSPPSDEREAICDLE